MIGLDCVVLCDAQCGAELIKTLSDKRTSGYLQYTIEQNKYCVYITNKETQLCAVAEWIVLRFGTEFLLSELSEQGYWMSEEEQTLAKEIALQTFKSAQAEFINTIYWKLINFTEYSKIINIYGFTEFSMNDIKASIGWIVESIIDELYLEEETACFIELLQYYIETEPSQMDMCIIKTDSGGNFSFFDANHQNITDECIELFYEAYGKADEEEHPNDILVGVLICLIPNVIVLYGMEFIQDKNVIETLKKIFGNRIQCHEKHSADC